MRFLSKQGQPQARFQSKDTKHTTVKWPIDNSWHLIEYECMKHTLAPCRLKTVLKQPAHTRQTKIALENRINFRLALTHHLKTNAMGYVCCLQ